MLSNTCFSASPPSMIVSKVWITSHNYATVCMLNVRAMALCMRMCAYQRLRKVLILHNKCKTCCCMTLTRPVAVADVRVVAAHKDGVLERAAFKAGYAANDAKQQWSAAYGPACCRLGWDVFPWLWRVTGHLIRACEATRVPHPLPSTGCWCGAFQHDVGSLHIQDVLPTKDCMCLVTGNRRGSNSFLPANITRKWPFADRQNAADNILAKKLLILLFGSSTGKMSGDRGRRQLRRSRAVQGSLHWSWEKKKLNSVAGVFAEGERAASKKPALRGGLVVWVVINFGVLVTLFC